LKAAKTWYMKTNKQKIIEIKAAAALSAKKLAQSLI
jgi:hypothetical protein